MHDGPHQFSDTTRLGIVGLGLIGGSLAAALKQVGFGGEIIALARNERVASVARERGLVDRVVRDLAAVARHADILMLAVPMRSMRSVIEVLHPALSEHVILTDAGSVKRCFIDDARSALGSLKHVVPGHPIAGSERSGVEAADPNLYRDRRVVLTPTAETDERAVAAVRQLWQRAGAVVEQLDADEHDRVLAATSHLPHALAFTLVDALATRHESEEIFRYAGAGFRDFTRIAGSDPVMWRDICLCNRDALLHSIDQFDQRLSQLRDAVATSDANAIEAMFERARLAREKHSSSQ